LGKGKDGIYRVFTAVESRHWTADPRRRVCAGSSDCARAPGGLGSRAGRADRKGGG